MRSKDYGDKQREAQQRKKQEELWAKSNPAPLPETETPPAEPPPAGSVATDVDHADQVSKKKKKKDAERRSA